LVQPLQLQVLLLQGVAVGDRGAALLARGLAGSQHLQVGPPATTCLHSS
jgi:hypothetical protein